MVIYWILTPLSGFLLTIPRLRQDLLKTVIGYIVLSRRRPAVQSQMMILHEKLQLGMKSIELEKQGRFEEAERVHKQIPLAPYLAKFLKDHLGVEALLQVGWNLSEAEVEYGPGWLSK